MLSNELAKNKRNKTTQITHQERTKKSCFMSLWSFRLFWRFDVSRLILFFLSLLFSFSLWYISILLHLFSFLSACFLSFSYSLCLSLLLFFLLVFPFLSFLFYSPFPLNMSKIHESLLKDTHPRNCNFDAMMFHLGIERECMSLIVCAKKNNACHASASFAFTLLLLLLLPHVLHHLDSLSYFFSYFFFSFFFFFSFVFSSFVSHFTLHAALCMRFLDK